MEEFKWPDEKFPLMPEIDLDELFEDRAAEDYNFLVRLQGADETDQHD